MWSITKKQSNVFIFNSCVFTKKLERTRNAQKDEALTEMKAVKLIYTVFTESSFNNFVNSTTSKSNINIIQALKIKHNITNTKEKHTGVLWQETSYLYFRTMKADWATRILLAANQIPVLSKTENMKTCFLLPKSFNSRWNNLIQRWKQNISFHTLTGCRNHSMNPEDDSLLRKETEKQAVDFVEFMYTSRRDRNPS